MFLFALQLKGVYDNSSMKKKKISSYVFCKSCDFFTGYINCDYDTHDFPNFSHKIENIENKFPLVNPDFHAVSLE